MQAIRTLLAALAAFGALELSGCAATGTERSTGQVLDDSTITAKVKTELAAQAGIAEAAAIDVSTWRGVVQLSGFVDSEQAARRAGELARQVEGVRSVENALRVAPEHG
jgi:osmotically-inducible protein OsmY